MRRAPLQRREVRLDHLTVAINREQQRDVHVDAEREDVLHRRESLARAGDLDHQRWAGPPGPQPPRRAHRPLRVEGKLRRDLERNEAVTAFAGVVERSKQIARLLDVGHGQRLEDRRGLEAPLGERANRRVIAALPATACSKIVGFVVIPFNPSSAISRRSPPVSTRSRVM